MKHVLILILVLSFCACTDTDPISTNDQTNIDTLPKGEWNGEFYEVKDTVADKKKPKKKSRGSEFYNMGQVEVVVDTLEFSIDLFEQKKNYVTISENSLKMRIKSAQNDYLSVSIQKPGIVGNYPGVYEIDVNGTKPSSSAIDFNRMSSEHKMSVFMTSGVLTLESFSPRLGKAVFNAQGTFEDRDGNQFPGKVNVNMRFESVVSTYNPNS